MNDKIVYRHIPQEGVFVYGVPARDITTSDLPRVDATALRSGIDAGLYVPVKGAPPSALVLDKPAETEGEAK